VKALAAALLMVFTMVASASAQVTGTVYGTVTDTSGGVIPGATVILINEAQNSKSQPVITTQEGSYTFNNIAVGVYTVEVTLSGFKSVTRKGLTVSRGDRLTVPTLVLQPGGVNDVVDVISQAPIIQASSGERSSSVARAQLELLPAPGTSHNMMAFVQLMPGMAPGTGGGRIGGGGQDNIMLDGLSALDTGNNGLMSGMNLPVDSIAEIKVVTSGYSAEYGRSSGTQVSAVTRSGTNRFHGSVYDYERDSDWNHNSWVNQANGVARGVSSARDWGFTIGGPVGKPGGDNKLFFFFTDEYNPRTTGGGVTNFRVPTALERVGDFSQTTDNNNALFNQIYDANTNLPKTSCTATVTTSCFKDGGVVGKIPLNRLYGPGLAWLNMYPMPNNTAPAGTKQSFNYTNTNPIQNTLTWTPVMKVDYQLASALRLTWRISAASARIVPALGNMPEVTTQIQQFPLSYNTSWAANYTLNPTTFIEASYGVNQNKLGTPSTSQFSNRNNIVCPADLAAQVSGCTMGALPFLFPDAQLINTGAYEYGALKTIGVPFLAGTEPCVAADEVGQTCGRFQLPPTVGFGGSNIANTPPNIGYPGFMNINRIQQTQGSITKVMGNHNAKAGVYIEHSYKAQNAQFGLNFQGNLNVAVDSNNPLDTQYTFSNLATGVFSTYSQANRFIEGNWHYDNIEWYLQDNWKVNPRLTLDYGVRFAHDGPYIDKFAHVANFFEDKWVAGNAPVLYTPGCVSNAATCTASNRVAKDPRTGKVLPVGSSGLIGSVILGSGDTANGMIVGGQQGTNKAGYTWPTLAVGPRFGGAYDVAGDQKMVLRGSVGMYFDRPDGNTAFGTVVNPPVGAGLSQQWGQLQALSNASLAFGPVSNVSASRYDNPIPKDVQWSLGVQRVLPWASSIDFSYVGHHQYDSLGGTQSNGSVNINAVDLGTTLVASGQDPTNTTPTALSDNLLRAYKGFGNINYQWGRFSRTFHSLQMTYNRNFRNGFSFQFTDTWTLKDFGDINLPGPQLRINHNADSSWYVRDDMAAYIKLMGDQGTTTHIAKANFTYDLPDLHSQSKVLRAVGLVVNDWQLSGVGTFDSGGHFDVGSSYNSGPNGQQLTGSSAYNGRLNFTDMAAFGSGCSSDQYAQLGHTIVGTTLPGSASAFMSTAAAGPQVGSVGMESGRNLFTACKDHRIDLAIQRTIKLGGNRSVVLRADMYNAFNTVIFNGRNSTISFNSTTDQSVRSSQFLADGVTVDPARLTPNQNAFGAVTGAQALRSIQGQVRFLF